MFQNIRTTLGSFWLQRSLRIDERTRKAVNLQEARSVCVLYAAANTEMPQEVAAFIRYLREEVGTLEVRSMGYYPQVSKWEEAPKPPHLKLARKDVDVFLRPKALATWKNKEVDVLIDLSLTDELPLLFCAAEIPAKMKVGLRSARKERLYQLLVELKGSPTQGQLIEQTTRYLQMLNRNSPTYGTT